MPFKRKKQNAGGPTVPKETQENKTANKPLENAPPKVPKSLNDYLKTEEIQELKGLLKKNNLVGIGCFEYVHIDNKIKGVYCMYV